MSQYAPGGSGGYQLLPGSDRHLNRRKPSVISSGLSQTNITTTGFTVGFETLYNGNTDLLWNQCQVPETSTSEDAAMTTSHTPWTCRSYPCHHLLCTGSISQCLNDTSWSAVAAMATSS